MQTQRAHVVLYDIYYISLYFIIFQYLSHDISCILQSISIYRRQVPSIWVLWLYGFLDWAPEVDDIRWMNSFVAHARVIKRQYSTNESLLTQHPKHCWRTFQKDARRFWPCKRPRNGLIFNQTLCSAIFVLFKPFCKTATWCSKCFKATSRMSIQ